MKFLVAGLLCVLFTSPVFAQQPDPQEKLPSPEKSAIENTGLFYQTLAQSQKTKIASHPVQGESMSVSFIVRPEGIFLRSGAFEREIPLVGGGASGCWGLDFSWADNRIGETH